MSYLQGNWKLQSKGIDKLLLGSGIYQGSWAGGAGTSMIHRGMVFGSIGGHNSIYSMASYEMMSMFYGSGIFGSGYKVYPFHNEIHPGSVAIHIYATESVEGSVCCWLPLVLTVAGAATQSTFTISMAGGASVSAHFHFTGLIVSTP